jgi:hypothetical protein
MGMHIYTGHIGRRVNNLLICLFCNTGPEHVNRIRSFLAESIAMYKQDQKQDERLPHI